MTIAYQLLNVQSSICHDPLSTDLRHVKFAHERACISLRIMWVLPVQDDYGCVDPPGKIAPLSDLISNPVNYCIFEMATEGNHTSQLYSVHPDLI